MTHQTPATGNREQRIRDAERNLFAAVGADVDEFFLTLARTDLRVRVLSHGHGPPVVLLHGVTENAAIWAPLFANLRHFRLLAVDLPGHGLSDPATSSTTFRAAGRTSAGRAGCRAAPRTRHGPSRTAAAWSPAGR
jgi:pimeloyl-ACP methyl ester carboxylesterase